MIETATVEIIKVDNFFKVPIAFKIETTGEMIVYPGQVRLLLNESIIDIRVLVLRGIGKTVKVFASERGEVYVEISENGVVLLKTHIPKGTDIGYDGCLRIFHR